MKYGGKLWFLEITQVCGLNNSRNWQKLNPSEARASICLHKKVIERVNDSTWSGCPLSFRWQMTQRKEKELRKRNFRRAAKCVHKGPNSRVWRISLTTSPFTIKWVWSNMLAVQSFCHCYQSNVTLLLSLHILYFYVILYWSLIRLANKEIQLVNDF